MEKYFKIVNSILKTQNLCFLGSVTSDGYPKVRAMFAPIKQEGNVYWLHTNTSSHKVEQFLDNKKACLYFFDKQNFKGIYFSGEVTPLLEHDQKLPFWKEHFKPYYQNGENLSDFCVIKFTALKGDYYSNFSVTTF